MLKPLLLLLSFVGFVSCSEGPPSPLVGEWSQERPEKEEIFFFREGGVFAADESESPSLGEWELDESVDPMRLRVSLVGDGDEGPVTISSRIRFLSTDRIELSGAEFMYPSGLNHSDEDDRIFIFVRQ